MRRWIALTATLIATGCVTGDGMQTKLRDTSGAYNRALRWGDVDRAAEHLPMNAQMAFMARHDEVKDKLVIVDYEVTRLDLDKNTGIAGSRAQITWHTERNLVIESTSVDQLWQFHEGKFWLVDERRSGGSPLAVFAEPEESPHPYLPGLEAYRKLNKIGEKKKKRRRRRSGKDKARQARR